jgi:hypothetical protein
MDIGVSLSVRYPRRGQNMSSEQQESRGVQHPSQGVATIVATLLGLAVVAIPLAGLTWDVLSDLISGHLGPRKALIGFPAMILLAIVLRFAARALVRLDTKRGNTTRTSDHS